MTSIPSFDYLRGLEEDRTETLRAVERVLDSGRLILGPELEAFEEEFAAYLGHVAPPSSMSTIAFMFFSFMYVGLLFLGFQPPLVLFGGFVLPGL